MRAGHQYRRAHHQSSRPQLIAVPPFRAPFATFEAPPRGPSALTIRGVKSNSVHPDSGTQSRNGL
ncbi:uncharacterized protein K460DRAFT_366851 [Cucurbitaria berberidis CBS 394.84]|uniref:Uncharacterized protein n=1 Tax=Cucurbitaria berberidis CBS 394.84 TaxID=1168544 RepID=A0A9P4GIT8_9PLEO|nr:uncharacterized protein K460DRAFT_366851 [Cucurbitaria berberidis CBS 394.84]KAF1846009.1 hypothetical protein K460DRAFT_366851 [Cucurbitaria berberidis CBS 394.84]